MTNKPLVLVDMDGVLADLNGGIMNMFGVSEPEGNRDRLFKEYLPAYTEANMFFKQPVLERAQLLIKNLLTLHNAGLINLAICTSTGKFYHPVSEVRNQKGKFIEYHFPDLVNVPFTTTTSGRDKAILAHPRAFLVDDHAPNVEKFIEAGGHGIIYNHTMDQKILINAILDAFGYEENVDLDSDI